MLAATTLVGCQRGKPEPPAEPYEPNASALASASASSHAEVRSCPDPEQEGWDRWEDPDTGTVLYVPRSRATLPAPVEWEPCGPGTQLDVPCVREAAVAPSTPTHLFGTAVDMSSPGTSVGTFGRRCPGWDFILLAEFQGPVLTALAQKRSWSWRRVQVREVVRGHWLASTRGRGKHTIFGGELGLGLPRRLDTLQDQSDGISVQASNEYVALQNRSLMRWNGERAVVPWEPAMIAPPTLWGSYVLYSRWHAGLQTAMVWDAAGGERVLFAKRGVRPGRMGTDGADVAFVASTKAGDFLGVAPLTGAVEGPRKLLALKTTPGVPVVGCGKAAVRTSYTEATLVRLVDGRSWTLASQEKCSLWCLEPLALNCQELVAQVYGPQWTMVRIGLSAMGEGMEGKPSPL